MTSTTEARTDLAGISDFDQATALRETLKKSKGVNHAGRVFFGSVLILSAVGLWLVPVDAGDAAMKLIKLLVSVLMLVLGVMFIFSARRVPDEPEIQIDTQAREIRIVKRDNGGAICMDTRHAIDSLSDVTLCDRTLTAYDASGQLIISMSVPDKRMETALKSALSL